MGSQNATRKNVAIGPSSSDARNHAEPLRPLPCARPALTSASVPQPAYHGLVISIAANMRGVGYWMRSAIARVNTMPKVFAAGANTAPCENAVWYASEGVFGTGSATV